MFACLSVFLSVTRSKAHSRRGGLTVSVGGVWVCSLSLPHPPKQMPDNIERVNRFIQSNCRIERMSSKIQALVIGSLSISVAHVPRKSVPCE